MTLISYSSSGGDVGRCDARCYDATRPHCDCICGGNNHGQGLRAAVRNTYHLGAQWEKQYRARHKRETVETHTDWEKLRGYLSGELFPVEGTAS